MRPTAPAVPSWGGRWSRGRGRCPTLPSWPAIWGRTGRALTGRAPRSWCAPCWRRSLSRAKSRFFWRCTPPAIRRPIPGRCGARSANVWTALRFRRSASETGRSRTARAVRIRCACISGSGGAAFTAGSWQRTSIRPCAARTGLSCCAPITTTRCRPTSRPLSIA